MVEALPLRCRGRPALNRRGAGRFLISVRPASQAITRRPAPSLTRGGFSHEVGLHESLRSRRPGRPATSSPAVGRAVLGGSKRCIIHLMLLSALIDPSTISRCGMLSCGVTMMARFSITYANPAGPSSRSIAIIVPTPARCHRCLACRLPFLLRLPSGPGRGLRSRRDGAPKRGGMSASSSGLFDVCMIAD